MIALSVRAPNGAPLGRLARVLLATTPEARRVGLAGIPRMPAGVDGMLFVFEPGARPTMWMADTHFALDLAFLDANGVVRRVIHGAPPDNTVYRYDAPGPTRYVLEVPSPAAAALGLAPGSVVVAA